MDARDKINEAKQRKVRGVESRLPIYFNSSKRCLLQTWEELARKLGLSSADIPELKKLVEGKGLSGPRR
ncbi:MAG TPA: hypothetical protein PKA63_09300 [Oligoflexia bacterium]|nr:hypothetical protein [Oligoflexia bacterium]HMP48849.1 hypothetical protein [Oligoflexia bacterium]